MDNSWAQLEHQATRIANLELMARFGGESWKAYNAALVRMLHQLQRQLQDLRKQIQEVNWQRKTSQNEAGEKLKNLEANWVSLVSKNYEIERACVELEKEIGGLEVEYDMKRKLVQDQPGARTEQLQEEQKQEPNGKHEQMDTDTHETSGSGEQEQQPSEATN